MKSTASRHDVRAMELLEPRQFLSAAHGITVSRPPAMIHGILEVPLESTPIAIVHTPNPSAVLPNLTAVVNWNDGSLPNQSVGPFSLDPHKPNTLVLQASHTSYEAGVFPVTIEIADAGHIIDTVHEPMRISQDNGHTIHALVGRNFLTRLGSIRAAGIDTTGLLIDWGDGSRTAPFLAGASGNSAPAAAKTTLISGDHTLFNCRLI